MKLRSPESTTDLNREFGLGLNFVQREMRQRLMTCFWSERTRKSHSFPVVPSKVEEEDDNRFECINWMNRRLFKWSNVGTKAALEAGTTNQGGIEHTTWAELVCHIVVITWIGYSETQRNQTSQFPTVTSAELSLCFTKKTSIFLFLFRFCQTALPCCPN